ncbi:XRE family transcriptional regulator [Paenarthrobacter ilicis]|uniref:XRE family transcriptional regulator n=1 Tax=Paenarthrobacter ilicis TaxID=43665 RepID=UPI00300806E1
MLRLVEKLPESDSRYIYGQRLRDARLLRGHSAKDTASQLGVGPVRYSRMENAAEPVAVNEDEARKISDVLQFSAEYFSTPVSGHVTSNDLCFRAKKAQTKTAVEVMTSWASVCDDLLRAAFEEVRPVPVALPDFPFGTAPEVAAEKVRNLWGFSSDEPIAHLTRRMERSGIYIFSAPFDTGAANHHDAVSLWVGPRREYPIVLLRHIDSWERIRMSLAHEAGHLVLHRFGKTESAEDEAFAFGSALLMPPAAFRAQWPVTVTLGTLQPLKLRWGVSLAAVIERGYRMGLLDQGSRTSLYKQLSRRDRRTGLTLRVQEPGWDEREPERPLLVSKLLDGRFGTTASLDEIRDAAAHRPVEFVRPLLEGQYKVKPELGNVRAFPSRPAAG